MRYGLTEEQDLIKQSVKEFVAEYVVPVAKAIDHTALYPANIFEQMAEYDYLGAYLPEKYGGAEIGFLSYIVIIEELAKVSGALAAILINHSARAAYAINQWGTEEQKQRFLGAMVKGEKLGSLAVKESGAAHDRVLASRQGNKYRLNGRKVYIANGGVADLYIVLAGTDAESGGGALSAFIVEADTPGVSIGQVHKMMGLRGCQSADIILNQVAVSDKNLLGNEGQGRQIVSLTQAVASVADGAQVVGIAQAALNEATNYSRHRIQFGQPIASFPAIQNMLAEMAANVHLLQLAVYHASQLIENGESFELEASIVKLFAAKIGQNVLSDAIQVEGGYGYIDEMNVSRLYRDMKGCVLKENSTDFPEQVIARELLKLYSD